MLLITGQEKDREKKFLQMSVKTQCILESNQEKIRNPRKSGEVWTFQI